MCLFGHDNGDLWVPIELVMVRWICDQYDADTLTVPVYAPGAAGLLLLA